MAIIFFTPNLRRMKERDPDFNPGSTQYDAWERPPEGAGLSAYWTEEPHFVVATRTELGGSKVKETQYTGFETKKGRKYAWGRDGKLGTDWIESDGTPMELKKPDGDGWELMVK